MTDDLDRVVAMALANPVNRTILERAPELGVPDWWLTGGAVFQSVRNALDGRDPRAGITDHDLFYFDDSDLSWESEDAVVQRAATLFADLDAVVEVRNEAPVLAPRAVYEAKADRWLREWPGLTVEPWPS